MIPQQHSQVRREIVLILCCWTVLAVLFFTVQYHVALVAIVGFFAYGIHTEIKIAPVALFSKTSLVVPLVVPALIFFAYAQMFLDGQVFTQKIVSIISCLVSFGILAFYGISGRLNKYKLSLAILLGIVNAGIFSEKLKNMGYAYEYQRNFNETRERSDRTINRNFEQDSALNSYSSLRDEYS